MDVRHTNPHLSSLQEIVTRKKTTETNLLWDVLTLFLYEKARSFDLVTMYKLLGMQEFTKLIYAVGGKEIKFPTRDELEDNLIAALLYIDREVYGLSWDEIKHKYPTLNISSIKFSIKIKSMNEFVKQQLDQLVHSLGDSDDEKSKSRR